MKNSILRAAIFLVRSAGLRIPLLCVAISFASRSSGNYLDSYVRPYYGIESTITNPCIHRPDDVERFKALEKRIKNDPLAAREEWFAEEFPEAFAQFNQFVANAFPRGTPPPMVLHKTYLPSYTKELSPNLWLRYQFECQAIELQAIPMTLSRYVGSSEIIEEEFYRRGEVLGIKPSREWGMGHLHEGIKHSYPLSRPEILRNRIVDELNNVYFWSLVGPNIESAINWEVNAEELHKFSAWLTTYDDWLKRYRIRKPGADHSIKKEMLAELMLNPEFFHLPEIDSLQLMTWIDRTDIRYLFRYLLNRAFFATHYKTGVAFALAHQDHHGNFATFEYRHIPAHQNALEAARWMALLEGRWRRVTRRRDLIPLLGPRPAWGNKLKLFRDYIEDSGMHPLDFAQFMTTHLGRFITESDSRNPRWSTQVTELCIESLLRHN